MSLPEWLRRVEERAENASPGPWNYSRLDIDSYTENEDGKLSPVAYVYRAPHERIPVCGPQFRNDSIFIAESRIDVPRLLATVRALAEALDTVSTSAAPEVEIKKQPWFVAVRSEALDMVDNALHLYHHGPEVDEL